MTSFWLRFLDFRQRHCNDLFCELRRFRKWLTSFKSTYNFEIISSVFIICNLSGFIHNSWIQRFECLEKQLAFMWSRARYVISPMLWEKRKKLLICVVLVVPKHFWLIYGIIAHFISHFTFIWHKKNDFNKASLVYKNLFN